mgnify:CR=1 FL=1
MQQYVEKIRATIESLLFITNEPLTPAEMEETDVQDVLSWLIEDYSDASKGIGVIKLGDGYIMAIKQAYLPYVEKQIVCYSSGTCHYSGLFSDAA